MSKQELIGTAISEESAEPFCFRRFLRDSFKPDWQGEAMLGDLEVCACTWRGVFEEISTRESWETPVEMVMPEKGLIIALQPYKLSPDAAAFVVKECQRVKGDDPYSPEALGILNHILRELDEEGEFKIL